MQPNYPNKKSWKVGNDLGFYLHLVFIENILPIYNVMGFNNQASLCSQQHNKTLYISGNGVNAPFAFASQY